MPQIPQPLNPNESENGDSVLDSSIQMRWQTDGGESEPVLLEIAVGTSWASTDLGRHLPLGIVDVDLPALCDIVESVAPADSGTPVVLNSGQVILTCEFGFGVMFDGRQ